MALGRPGSAQGRFNRRAHTSHPPPQSALVCSNTLRDRGSKPVCATADHTVRTRDGVELTVLVGAQRERKVCTTHCLSARVHHTLPPIACLRACKLFPRGREGCEASLSKLRGDAELRGPGGGGRRTTHSVDEGAPRRKLLKGPLVVVAGADAKASAVTCAATTMMMGAGIGAVAPPRPCSCSVSTRGKGSSRGRLPLLVSLLSWPGQACTCASDEPLAMGATVFRDQGRQVTSNGQGLDAS